MTDNAGIFKNGYEVFFNLYKMVDTVEILNSLYGGCRGEFEFYNMVAMRYFLMLQYGGIFELKNFKFGRKYGG
jgi:hypothetical protein